MDIRINFVVPSQPVYRTLGPMIEAAARDRTIVPRIILGPDFDQSQMKAYQSTSLDKIPERLRPCGDFRKPETLAAFVAELEDADVNIALTGSKYQLDFAAQLFAQAPPPDALLRIERAKWVIVADSFYINDVQHSDRIFWTGAHLGSFSSDELPDDIAGQKEKIIPVGYVRADVLASLDRGELRRSFGIPENRPCVLFVPDPSMTRNDPSLNTPWYFHRWCTNSRMARFKWTMAQAKRPLRAMKALFERSGHQQVLAALRRFCDANGAFLLVVPRRQKDAPKGPLVLADERAIADHVVPAGETYPQAMFQALLAADLVVCSYRSGTLLDAAAVGRPIITTTIPNKAFTSEVLKVCDYYDKAYGGYEGFHWIRESETFIRDFPTAALSDFPLNDMVLERFRRQHVGELDGKASVRVLAHLKDLFGRRRAHG